VHAFVKLEPTAEGEPAHKLDDRETRERRLELPPHPLKRKGPALTSKGFGSHLTEWMIMPPTALGAVCPPWTAARRWAVADMRSKRATSRSAPDLLTFVLSASPRTPPDVAQQRLDSQNESQERCASDRAAPPGDRLDINECRRKRAS